MDLFLDFPDNYAQPKIPSLIFSPTEIWNLRYRSLYSYGVIQLCAFPKENTAATIFNTEIRNLLFFFCDKVWPKIQKIAPGSLNIANSGRGGQKFRAKSFFTKNPGL